MFGGPRRLAAALLASLAVHGLPPPEAAAGGPVHGAAAAGMGTAFVGKADDPSALVYNPAGITQIRRTSVYAGVTAVSVRTEFQPRSGGGDETEARWFFPPHLFLVVPAGDTGWTLGLGLYSPFGIGGRRWDRESRVRYGSIESTIATFTVGPSVAYRVNPAVSIAVGVDYLRIANRGERLVDQSFLGAGDAGFEVEGRGDGWGYNASLLVRVSDALRLGFAYHSEIRAEISGDARLWDIAPALQPAFGADRFETGADTVMDFPEIISLGLAYDPTPRWTLAFDLEFVRWSSFDTAAVDFHDEVPQAGFVDSTAPLDWKDSLQVKAGVEYRPGRTLSVRAGYAFIPTPVPDETLGPENPDADSHNLTVGVGLRRSGWRVDLSGAVGFFENRPVSDGPFQGSFSNRAAYLGLSVGHAF